MSVLTCHVWSSCLASAAKHRVFGGHPHGRSISTPFLSRLSSISQCDRASLLSTEPAGGGLGISTQAVVSDITVSCLRGCRRLCGCICFLFSGTCSGVSCPQMSLRTFQSILVVPCACLSEGLPSLSLLCPLPSPLSHQCSRDNRVGPRELGECPGPMASPVTPYTVRSVPAGCRTCHLGQQDRCCCSVSLGSAGAKA